MHVTVYVNRAELCSIFMAFPQRQKGVLALKAPANLTRHRARAVTVAGDRGLHRPQRAAESRQNKSTRPCEASEKQSLTPTSADTTAWRGQKQGSRPLPRTRRQPEVLRSPVLAWSVRLRSYCLEASVHKHHVSIRCPSRAGVSPPSPEGNIQLFISYQVSLALHAQGTQIRFSSSSSFQIHPGPISYPVQCGGCQNYQI